MTSRWQRLATWRRVAAALQAAAVLGLPFVTVGGESALRLDVPTLTLHAFGARVGLDELLVVLAASLLALFAFLLVSLLFGRVWCGFGCPQTALLDLTAPLEKARRRGGWRQAAALLGLAAVAALVSANLLCYFVPPAELGRRVLALSPGPVLGPSWAVLFGLVLADLGLWRHGFCATTCPYAKLQGAFLDRHSMAVAYDRRRAVDCVDCGACVRVCPVAIDIRDGLQARCVSCGDCVDACDRVMRKLKRAPRLVGWFFGEPGTGPRFLRPAAVALGVLTAGALALAVAVAAERSPLEVTVTAAGDLAPRRAASGEAWSAFTVAVENRGRAPLELALSAVAPGAKVALRPDAVRLAPGEHRRVRVLAAVSGAATGRLAARLTVTAAPGARVAPVERAITLELPEARP